jgi:hypothetical protein
MNRKERRAARKLGDVIHTTTIGLTDNIGRVHLYWFESTNFSPDDLEALKDHCVAHQRPPPGVTMHGPFATEAEVNEHQRLTLLGPQCEVTEGGAWDPKWDKPQ